MRKAVQIAVLAKCSQPTPEGVSRVHDRDVVVFALDNEGNVWSYYTHGDRDDWAWRPWAGPLPQGAIPDDAFEDGF